MNSLKLQPLDRTSFVPLYLQLTENIARLIRSGKVKAGTLLPSEAQCGNQLGVSRLTVRQAMARLVSDGLVLRERGRGTYVRSSHVVHNFVYSFEEEMQAGNRPLSMKVLSWQRVRPSQEVAQALAIPPRSCVFRLERLKLIDGVPIGREIRHLPEWIGSGIQPQSLVSDPVYKLVKAVTGTQVARIESTVACVLASAGDAKLLRIKRRAPLLVREQTYYTADDTPLVQGTVVFRGDRYQFRFQCGPGQLRMGTENNGKLSRHRFEGSARLKRVRM